MRRQQETSALGSAARFISSFAGKVIIGALLVLLLFEGVRWSFAFGHAIFYQEPAEAAPGKDHEIELEQGETLDTLAKTLAKNGIIRNELAFVIQGKLYETALYPGTYTLNTSMTTKEILDKLETDGERLETESAAGSDSAEGAAEDENVIGGGDDAVDAAQQEAAEKSGAKVKTDAADDAAGSDEDANAEAVPQDIGSGDEGE